MTDPQAISRSERLLALLVLHNMGDASQVEKTVMLSRAQFTNGEIADLLGTSTAVVSQNLYSSRKLGAKKPAASGKRSAKANP